MKTCELCNYEYVDVHKTPAHRITYCQGCGNETKEEKNWPKKVFDDEDRRKRLREGGDIVPLRSKKKKQSKNSDGFRRKVGGASR